MVEEPDWAQQAAQQAAKEAQQAAQQAEQAAQQAAQQAAKEAQEAAQQAEKGAQQALEEAAEVSGVFGRLRSGDTFLFLFALLIATLMVSIIGNEHLAGRIVGAFLSGAAPLVAFRAAKASRRWIVAGWFVFVATVILSVFGEWIDQPYAVTSINFLHMVLLFFCIPITLRRLLEHETVTGETVAGSLCVYLLLGLAFANLYLAISAGGASPVLLATAQNDVPLTRGDFFYFSFIGMLTVGFGDVVPVTQWAKALTVVQAVFGQVVLLTLVARMVSTARIQHGVRRGGLRIRGRG